MRALLFISLILLSSPGFTKDTLVLGKVTVSERQSKYRNMKPLVDYVAQQLSAFGIKKGEVIFTKNNKDMIEAIKAGKVDWVTDSTFSAIIMANNSPVDIILKRSKEGISDYHSVIVVNKSSSITDIENLKGKKIAFEDIGSTSGYFLPFLELITHHIKPIKINKNSNPVKADEVGYSFFNSEQGGLMALLENKVDALAFSNLDYDSLAKSIKENLRIIHHSEKFPRGLELLNKNMNHKIKEKIINSLLKYKNKKNETYELYTHDKNIDLAKKIIKSNSIPIK